MHKLLRTTVALVLVSMAISLLPSSSQAQQQWYWAIRDDGAPWNCAFTCGQNCGPSCIPWCACAVLDDIG